LNAGELPEDIVQAVRSDATLASLPYLREVYDHPQFIVRNLLRLWGGWWNGNAADLLPATFAAQAKEIADLAGGTAAIVARARALLAQRKFELASHLAEWAARAAPDDREAQMLKRDVYEQRLAAEPNLMAQGVFRGAMNDAKEALGEERVTRAGQVAL
jgi:alkyl sulfatase BDS1-like metallo-beta-lactamase superfamily hydrolase